MAVINEAPSPMHNVKAFNNNTQSKVVTQGQDAQVSPTDWDPDRPLPVNGRNGAVPGNGGGNGGNANAGGGGADAGTTPVGGGDTGGNVAPGGDSTGGEGLAWFTTHFKEIAIVAGAAAVLAGIIALIKSMSKSIKIRYNKCVKTLQRTQKDFTLKPDGLNMKAVLPGVGSKLNDWLSRLFTWNWKAGKEKTGNIGLHPFCDRYKEEIAADYEAAKMAFSKIRATVDEGGEINSSADVVYKSFREAIISGNLYEGYTSDMNESMIMGILGSFAASTLLRGMKSGAGVFKAPKIDKDGKIDFDSTVAVQVTKESTREICYAIINNFADKYINMEAVYKQLGIDSKSLADLDASSCDKLAKMIEAYAKPEKNKYTKQYTRIKGAYDKMLKHYFAIGDGIIDNFKKYTQAEDEKHANLLVASVEKLKNMWDTQKDIYENNFSHVVVEIISSEGYINYLNFILNNVMPVFKSGLAGDADYVLDMNPKKNEYFVVKQTGNKDALGGNYPVIPEGKSVLVKVDSYNKDSKQITFELMGVIDGQYQIYDDGVCDISGCKINFDSYKEDGKYQTVTIGYGKWLSLDPTPTDWEPVEYTAMYYKPGKVDGKEIDLYVFAHKDADDNENGFTKVTYVSYNPAYYDMIGCTNISVSASLDKDGMEQVFKNADFGQSYFDVDLILNNAKICKNKNEVEVDGGEQLKEYLLGHNPGLPIPVKSSDIYKKESDKFDIYVYAWANADLESEKPAEGTQQLNEDDTMDPSGDGANNQNITKCVVCSVKKGTDIATSDLKKVDFNGSFVNLKPCSIKEFDEQMKSLEYNIVEGDKKAMRKKLFDKIIFDSGEFKDKPGIEGEFDIHNIEDPIDEIVGRKGSAEKVEERIDEITQVVLDKIGKAKKENKEFKVKSEGGNLSHFLKVYYPGKESVVKVLETEANTSVGHEYYGGNINIRVFGLLNKDNKVSYVLTVMDSKKGATYYYTAANDKDSIRKAVAALAEMLKDHEQKKDILKFDYAEPKAENPSQGIVFDDCVRDLTSLVGIDVSTGLISLKDTTKNETENVKIEPFENTPGKLTIIFKGKDKTQFKFTAESDGKGDVDVYAKDENHKYGGRTMDEFLRNIRTIFDEELKDATQNTQQQPQNNNAVSSSVVYTFANPMSESESNSVIVSRHIDGRYKNAYILSEAVYQDYMNDSLSKLDESDFVLKLRSKDDCMKFAKSNTNAHFVKFTNDMTYNIISEKNYTPSDQTPLYESVVLFEFNSNDRITKRINLGTKKIS